MFNVVIASHGCLADEFFKVLKSFFGELKNVETLNLSDKGLNTFSDEIEALMKTMVNEDTFVLCDIPGGTPFNELAKRSFNWNANFSLLGGVNLPILVEILNLRMQGQSLEKTKKHIESFSSLNFFEAAEEFNSDDE